MGILGATAHGLILGLFPVSHAAVDLLKWILPHIAEGDLDEGTGDDVTVAGDVDLRGAAGADELLLNPTRLLI